MKIFYGIAVCAAIVLPQLALAGLPFGDAALGQREGATEGTVSSADAPAPQVPQHLHRSRLEERVSALANALQLDATQRAQLTKVLEWQRAQVRKVWNDSSVPPDYRVTAAHDISDKTAEQIRGLLNEEQKSQYKLPRQPHPTAEGEGQRSVEAWMNAMNPR